MLGIVYYGDNHSVISPSHEMGIVVAMLSGSLIGQLFFGIAAEYVWIEQTILHQKISRDQLPVSVEVSLEKYLKQLLLTSNHWLAIYNSKLGRRKIYGWELVVTIFATIGVATASYGVNGSLSILGGLISYRFILGLGIGAGYPLSAVICSE